MEMELNAEREKLLAEKALVESELTTVNEDLTNRLTEAKSQVSKITKLHVYFQFLFIAF